MQKTEKRRAFIINFAYILIIAALIFVLLKFAMPFLMPFVLAFIISFALKPVINFLDKKLPIPRKIIAAVILTVLYVLFGLALFFLGAKLISSAGVFFTTLPSYFQNEVYPALEGAWGHIESFFVQLDPSISSTIANMSDTIFASLSKLVTDLSSGVIGGATNVATSVPGFVTSCFILIISSYFFTVDYYRITGFIKSKMSDKLVDRFFVVKNSLINVLISFFKAYVLIILMTFVEITIGLLILRVPNAIVIALVIALLDVLPVLGSGTVLVPWTIYNLLTGNFVLGIGLLILYAVVTVVRQLAEPRIVGKQIGLYPLLTLASMFIGARLFGFAGLFGLPIALSVIVNLYTSGEIKLFGNDFKPDGKAQDNTKNNSDQSTSSEPKESVTTFAKEEIKLDVQSTSTDKRTKSKKNSTKKGK